MCLGDKGVAEALFSLYHTQCTSNCALFMHIIISFVKLNTGMYLVLRPLQLNVMFLRLKLVRCRVSKSFLPTMEWTNHNVYTYIKIILATFLLPFLILTDHLIFLGWSGPRNIQFN